MNFRLTTILFFTLVTLAWIANYLILFPFWVIYTLILLYVSMLILGSIFIEWNFYLHSINSINELENQEKQKENSKQICLTFDDGIHPVNTPKALEILAKQNVKAHFFLIGKNIIGNEHIVMKMKNDGHIIGNHSQYHLWNFDLQSSSQMCQELISTNEIIEKITGDKPTLFRPPYGVTNPNLKKAIQQCNMISIGWNVRSMDTIAKSKKHLLDKLIKKTKPNSIILLHERCDVTLEVLTEYMEHCKAQGYTFVTLK